MKAPVLGTSWGDQRPDIVVEGYWILFSASGFKSVDRRFFKEGFRRRSARISVPKGSGIWGLKA